MINYDKRFIIRDIGTKGARLQVGDDNINSITFYVVKLSVLPKYSSSFCIAAFRFVCICAYTKRIVSGMDSQKSGKMWKYW